MSSISARCSSVSLVPICPYALQVESSLAASSLTLLSLFATHMSISMSVVVSTALMVLCNTMLLRGDETLTTGENPTTKIDCEATKRAASDMVRTIFIMD